jgi:hypothetical protein
MQVERRGRTGIEPIKGGGGMSGDPGMDSEFIKWLTTLGVGGVLAGVIFNFYRKDIRQYTDLWQSTSAQLMTIVKDNTASNTKLVALLENQERNALRKSDLEELVRRRRQDTEGPRSHPPDPITNLGR